MKVKENLGFLLKDSSVKIRGKSVKLGNQSEMYSRCLDS